MPQNDDPMAEIRASFFIECEELLESLQDAMAAMAGALEQGFTQDPETINVAFRAVHSIKGGAGAFGLTALVAFAHRFETVMDELRAGRMEVDPLALKLFFQAADMLTDQVRLSQQDAAASPPDAAALLEEMEALIAPSATAAPAEAEPADFTPMGLALDFGAEDPATAEAAAEAGAAEAEATGQAGGSSPAAAPWRVRFTPLTALYSSGNEALHILRALRALGDVTISCDCSALPEFSELDAEASRLSWQICVPGSTPEREIRDIFDFVEDLAEITVERATRDRNPDTAAPPADPRDLASPALPAPPASALPEPALREPAATDAAPGPPTAGPATAPRVAPRADAGSGAPAPPADPASATVRVDLDRIDRLVNLVGELVINQAMLAQSVTEAGLPANSTVMNGLEAFMMLTRDIQDSVMMIRAQPVKPLFQRMARIVREASAAVGKEVRLRTEGEGTEVDKTVIERLADPLTHMIRNAVDHGLEPPEGRRAAGKPPEGQITLSAQHRSGRVVIEIADDGAGINRPKVREIAISKGLIAAEATLSDSEIDNLLFLPGFSTASQISSLSGRGVGMDVVRQAILALGGRISITSERGRGTRFSISLPLTLAVLDGMVVRVAGETLVVPLSVIVETATLTRADIRLLGPETSVIHIRGGFVPLYDLGAELGYREPLADYAGCIVLLTAQDDGSRAALVVEEIMEQRQVVIKGLQQGYGHIPGVAAATILGDGQIALILDPGDLVQNASGRTRRIDSLATLPLAG